MEMCGEWVVRTFVGRCDLVHTHPTPRWFVVALFREETDRLTPAVFLLILEPMQRMINTCSDTHVYKAN